jgi:hypothetical protein
MNFLQGNERMNFLFRSKCGFTEASKERAESRVFLLYLLAAGLFFAPLGKDGARTGNSFLPSRIGEFFRLVSFVWTSQKIWNQRHPQSLTGSIHEQR